MKIELWQVSKTKERYLQDGVKIYIDRLKHFCKLSTIDFKEEKTSKNSVIKIVQEKESKQFIQKFSDQHYIVLLDEKGKQYTSRGFSSFIEKRKMDSYKTKTVFIIGGAYGFSDEIRKRANAIISLSSMTYSHQMIRLFFLEQLYRAFTIINGHSYHND
jgi:23S rRNA (pseudouridine1915-N3)-methyltransferase